MINFRGLDHPRKFFSNENFPGYGSFNFTYDEKYSVVMKQWNSGLLFSPQYSFVVPPVVGHFSPTWSFMYHSNWHHVLNKWLLQILNRTNDGWVMAVCLHLVVWNGKQKVLFFTFNGSSCQDFLLEGAENSTMLFGISQWVM